MTEGQAYCHGPFVMLYYLKERHAYARQLRQGIKHTLEFAGPYPVTDGEFRLLNGFRQDPSRQPEIFESP